MERQLQQRDLPVNMTAALEKLTSLMSNPRRTVIQVEASTSVVLTLLLLQLILGSFRRQTSSAWVQVLSGEECHVPTLGYLTISLLLAAGCTNAVKVHELGENKQWKRNLFNYMQYVAYTSSVCALLMPDRQNFVEASLKKTYSLFVKSPVQVFISLAAVISATSFFGRDVGCLFVDWGYFHVSRVSKFMNNLPANDDRFDPVSMEGYRYPLRFIPRTEKAITIDQIWQCEGSLLSSGSSKGLKDVCLAYAMYKLLKRRYYGMACAEEHLVETRDFVLKGLLGAADDGHSHERAFKIVEVELGFCHDYFFTKQAIIFERQRVFFLVFVFRIGLLLVVAYFFGLDTLAVGKLPAIIEVPSRRTDNIINVLVLAIILLIELLQAAFYMASDWCKVSLACKYVYAGSWYQGNAFFEKLMGYVTRFSLFGYWKNRIDQYSVLSKLTANEMTKSDLQAVKLAIVRTLRSFDGLPTNGERSLRKNGMFAEFSWALQGRHQAEIMLVWHIATEHVNGTSYGNEEETEFHRKVSVSLSRYCAYLMDSALELLPGYFGDAKTAMLGVKKAVESQDGVQDREENRSILIKGMKLGKQLEGMEDIADRWKVLADFWTEKILYVAPSDNVEAHMERLAKGGEFLTHIWALLTHAGIHKINREEDRNTMPSQPSQASV
ncbi:unnamed protein product [Alopecurus aequalis]